MIPFPGTFYWRNKARSVPLFILISLSVAVIGVVATLTGSILESIYSAEVRPFEHFTLLISKELMISECTMRPLLDNPSIRLLVPFLDSSIRTKGFLGSERRRVYALPGESMDFVLDALSLELTAGRLPIPGSNEIVLHESIINSRNLAIGSFVGQEVDQADYLWGLFEVSGVISGPVPIGAASFEYFKQQWMFELGDNAYALMAFPTTVVQKMNETFPTDIHERLLIRDYDYAFESYQSESREMDLLLWVVNIAIIGIISLSMGMLNTIHFLTRMKEYGILTLIGLDLNTLLRRTFLEVLILSLWGFMGGIIISWVLTWVVSKHIFSPRGIQVGIYSFRYLIYTLPIPLFLTVFSFLTIWWNIRQLDVIAVIEGRD
ncbi:MAG: ABC transporter permease [Firmicutes bacterium]|nr:ABC transporter permease [Bacillota bacterium]